jgi:hypothetical protein
LIKTIERIGQYIFLKFEWCFYSDKISEMDLLVETMTTDQRNKIWQDRRLARQIWPQDTEERRQILALAENTAALWETIEMALVQLQDQQGSDIAERRRWLRIGWSSCMNKYTKLETTIWMQHDVLSSCLEELKLSDQL